MPAPFGPQIATRAPGLDLGIEMMHGRMTVVAERQVMEADGGAHGRSVIARPKAVAAHKAPITTRRRASRAAAESRSKDAPGIDPGPRQRGDANGSEGACYQAFSPSVELSSR